MKKKPIILIIIVLVLILLGSYKFFFAKKENNYNIALVEKGNIKREVSATGRVKKGEELNLGFKQSGRADKIYVEVGQEVEKGKELIKLDTNQLLIQLSQAKASLDLAKAEYDKLLAGASVQEIQAKQTAVDNAKIAHNNAQKNLDNVKQLADENLESAYDDAINVLEDSYLKIYNAFSAADSIQRTYFNGLDQESFLAREKKSHSETLKNQAKSCLDSVKASSSNQNIDSSLLEIGDILREVYDDLKAIREVCESANYRSTVSSSDKTSLDNQKSYLNTVLTSVVNTQQTIANTKIVNKSNIDSAQTSLDSAEGSLKTAQDQLVLITTKPRQEDINLYEAKVRQAQASYNLLADQIADSTIKSPVDGQVAKINKEIGEQATLGESIVSLIPAKPFQIETDISEADIGKINIENLVKIILDAFPEEEFSGKIIEIEPSETIIDGVVYYKIKINLETEDEKIKPGMTANLTIMSDSRENVLTIPYRAVTEKDGKKIVKVLIDDNNFKEVEVQTGLKGSGGEIEVLSGLKEGDQVITLIKEQ